MDFVIKVFDNDYWIKYQLFDFLSLSYKEELKGNGECVFVMSLENVKDIKEFDKIWLYSVDNWTDTYLFDGYVRIIEYNFETVKFTVSSIKKYLKKKVIFEEKEFTSVAVSSVLSELFTEQNTRSGSKLWYWTDKTDLVSKTFSKGTKYFDIINDIAETLGFDWICRLWVVYFWTLDDKTTLNWNEYFKQNLIRIHTEKILHLDFASFTASLDSLDVWTDITYLTSLIFLYNAQSPYENTVDWIKVLKNSDDIYTSLLISNWTSEWDGTENTDEFWFIEHYENASVTKDVQISEQGQNLVDTNSQSYSEYEIRLNSDRFWITDINIWSKCRVIIESLYSYININEDFYINKKEITIVNKKPVFKITVAKEKIQTSTIWDVISDLYKKIQFSN